jgi:hypothetical protein
MYAFETPGMHVIALKVTNTVSLNYVAVPPMNVCVYPLTPTVSFNFGVNNTVSTNCDSPQQFSITNLNITGCSDVVTYVWQISYDGGDNWQCVHTGCASNNANVFAYAEARAYIMRVTITASCSRPDVLCWDADPLSGSYSATQAITFVLEDSCP